MKLSENFTLDEFTASQTAVHKGIDNSPTPEHIENMRALCEHILEPLRTALGRPINISSGYRSVPLNKAIGGSSKSQHSKGEAADIQVHRVDAFDVAQCIEKMGLPYDQLIFEGTWVHVSYRANPRGEVLTAVFRRGRKTQYFKGIRYV